MIHSKVLPVHRRKKFLNEIRYHIDLYQLQFDITSNINSGDVRAFMITCIKESD